MAPTTKSEVIGIFAAETSEVKQYKQWNELDKQYLGYEQYNQILLDIINYTMKYHKTNLVSFSSCPNMGAQQAS